MDLIILGDIHLLEKNPIARKDDLTSTQWVKLKQVFERAWLQHQSNGAIVCIPGDFTDKPRSWNLLREIIRFLKFYQLPVLAVFGQHDTYMNSSKLRPYTNLGMLAEFDLVKILGSKPLSLGEYDFYGASWGEDIPEIENPNKVNVLLTHRSIAENPLYPGHNYIDAEDFSEEHDFDIIICGDIHREFIIQNCWSNWIVNAGPLLRKEATKYNFSHLPCFYIYSKNKFFRTSVSSQRGLKVLSRKHMVKENEMLVEHFDIEINEDEELTFKQELLLVMQEFEDEFETEFVIDILGNIMEVKDG